MALRPWLLGSSIALVLAFGQGCSGSQEEESDGEESALEDSGKIVPTTQTDLLLFQGYNTLFDQGHSGCVKVRTVKPQIGERGVDVKMSLVKSRDDLAKQLGFETDLSFKMPKVGVDARAQVMNSFKRNSTSTTLLVRVGSYYSVDGSQGYELTPDAAALLQRDPRGFLQRCGDAVVTKLQYRAEVLGLMRFDSMDQQKTTETASKLGGQVSAIKNVADVSASVGATSKKIAEQSKSSVSLDLVTQGFVPSGNVSLENLQGDFEAKLKALLETMARSVEKDVAADTAALEKGLYPYQPSDQPATTGPRDVIKRNARLSGLTFHAYAKNQSTSMASVANLTQGARGFLLEIGDVAGRMENAYYEEVNAFLSAKDQETYNLASAAQNSVTELEKPAQAWSAKLNPARTDSVAGRLKQAQLECVNKAIAGDYNACKKTDATAKLVTDGRALLDEYNANGRVVRMNVLYGSSAAVTVDVARTTCTNVGGRLPSNEEMTWLKPAITRAGPVWVSASTCPKNIGIYTGQSTPKCYDGWFVDWYDSAATTVGFESRTAPVLCVANSGPRPVLAPPGE